jgi:glycosyltransferase involved in cell wall biosynthesis
MKLTTIVPVFNEAKQLKKVIELLMTAPCQIEREWIFVDDGSTDGSREILKELQSVYSYRLILKEENGGKGSAVMKAIPEAGGDLIMVQDADFEYSPSDIPNLLEPLIQDSADVVYGSRFKNKSQQAHQVGHTAVNRFLTLSSNFLTGLDLTDVETCYKVFKADLLQSMNLTSQHFGIEVELTAYIAKTTARLTEVPIHYHPRTPKEGKKINWKDGVAALKHLVYFNKFVSKDQAFTNLPDRYRRKIPDSNLRSFPK